MKVAFYTLGCKVNQYETQAMEQMMTARGHQLVPFEGEADAYVINICSVTAVSDKKSRQMIRRARKAAPDAILAVCGCYAQTHPEDMADLSIDLVAGTGDRAGFADLLEQVNAMNANITASVGSHTISVIAQSSYSTVSTDLRDAQTENSQNLLSLQTQIDQLQQSRTGLDSNFEDTTKEWESTEEPVLQSTRISSAVLKFGLIGLLAGIVLVCGAGTVQFLVQGKVYSGKELRDTCRLPLLGTLASGKTRQSKQLDAALDRMEHRPDGSTDAEMIRLMAATIASRAPEAKHILITGDLPADQLTALAAALQDTGALRAQVVTAAESVLTCAATVPQVTSADAIVLAADCTCSHYTAVNDQNEQIQRLGKNILGCIVFE